MDQTTRNHLQRATQDARRLLESEFAAQLEGTFDILPHGRILPEPGKHLDDRQRLIRGQIVEAIEHIRAKEGGKTIAQAIDDYRREAAFTFLNRFAALKMLEARGLVQQCVSKGDLSGGFKEFTGLAPGLSELPDKGYQLYLECLFDELGTEVKILFDRRDPASLLWPRRQALLDLLDILNRPELANVWGEDEAIGWVYQYFNGQEERRAMREASAAPRNSRELAVRNQFFTPRYVVEFLTDNTLGRIWYEMRQGRTALKEQCRYMVRKPDEVFLAASTAAGETGSEGCVRMAHELTAASEADFPTFSAEDNEQIQRMSELGHCVSAYEQLGEGLADWFQSAKGSIESGQFDGQTTGEILNYLFFTCRADRHGGYGSVYREPWFAEAANEVRRRFLAAREEGLSQTQLLKAPVAIPYRPKKDPRDLKVLDPACGSGHFLLYCFDLLITIYLEAWEDESSPTSEATGKSLREDYSSADALRLKIPELILLHNLHGIDIDPRCAQIAALALWMRAQRAFNDFGICRDQRPAIRKTNIVIAEPMPDEHDMLDGFLRSLREDRLESLMRKAMDIPEDQRVRATKAMADSLCQLVQTVWEKMKLAGEVGSLLKIEQELTSAIEKGRDEWEEKLPLFRVTEYSFDGQGSEKYYRQIPGVDEDFWDQAETLTICAIEEYASSSRNGNQFRRRMFAEDATRGFAFVDLCRKHYDIVLMNPPFGKCSLGASHYFDTSFSDFKTDIGIAFVDRFLRVVTQAGCVGAITSRSFLANDSFDRWRAGRLLKETPINCFLDLGYGVLDDALVEAAAYVVDATASLESPRFFIRALESRDKELSVRNFFQHGRSGSGLLFFLHDLREFRSLPLAVICYWLPTSLLRKIQQMPTLSALGGAARHGLITTDDGRLLRLTWEIPAESMRQDTKTWWRPLAKGGEYQPFWDDIHLCVDWSGGGRTLKTFLAEKRLRTQGSADWSPWLNHSEYYGLEGLTYPERTTSDFCPRVLPKDVVFSGRGQAIHFHGSAVSVEAYLCGAFSRFFKLVVDSFVGSGDNAFPGSAAKLYRSGLLNQLPSPLLDGSGDVARIAREGIAFAMTLFVQDETSRYFCPERRHQSLREMQSSSQEALLDSAVRVIQNNLLVEKLVSSYFNLSDYDHKVLDEIIGPHPETYSSGGNVEARTITELWMKPVSHIVDYCIQKDGPRRQLTKKSFLAHRKLELICHGLGLPPETVVRALKSTDCLDPDTYKNAAKAEWSFSLGCVFGRWDIRFATGEKSAPESPDPFSPLPICPPGSLQNEQNQPLSKDDVGRLQAAGRWHYPLDIPWNGILVDDPGHSLDIVSRVQRVLELVWNDQWEATEREACEILGVRNLRDYFRKPAAYFAEHLSVYSKSRRQAPIYWPLSSSGSAYTIWLYCHRFRRDTLFQALNDFAKPKLQHERHKLDRLQGEAGPQPTRSQREAIEAQESFVSELEGFVEDLTRVASLWNPDLNDGVIINYAPLWRMIGHNPWRKCVKECWDTLCAGDYDWSHLAMHLWPDRVVPKCIEDGSLAIAHGLDEIFWEKDERDRLVRKPPPPGGWRPVIDRLIAERTSPAVKSALESLLCAPAPAGSGSGRRGTRTSTTPRRVRSASAPPSESMGIPPQARASRARIDTDTMDAVKEALASFPGGASKADILSATAISDGRWNTVINALIEQGVVVRVGERRGARYRLQEGGTDA